MICYKCNRVVESKIAVHGLHPHCWLLWFQLKQMADFSQFTAQQTDPTSSGDFDGSTISRELYSSFFQGKFKKYSAVLDGQHYLLKVQEKEYPELPMVEYFCNQVAKSLKLNVPDFYLICLENKLNTFVTYNFVHNHPETHLIHIYRYFNKEDLFDCETLLKIIYEKTQRISAVEFFIKMCLFDSLIGNHDRHGRNIGLIQKNKLFELSPMYDNPSYLGIEDDILLAADHGPKGKVATKNTDCPNMQDYVIEFKRLDFFNVIVDFFNSINLKHINELLIKSPMSEKRRVAMAKLIAKRYQELKNAVAV